MPQPSLNDRDVDADIAADWAAIVEKHSADPGDENEPAAGAGINPSASQAAPESEEEQNAGGEDAGQRERDAAGRFVAAAKAAKPAAGAAATPADAPAAARPAKPSAAAPASSAAAQPSGDPPAAPAADATQTARDINRAPSTWKPAVRAEWEKLPPAVRAEIHRREADYLNGQQQLMPDAQLGSAMRRTIAPYEALIASQGGTPDAVVGNLLRTAAVFAIGSPQQKLHAVASIAQEYGIDLRQLVGGTTPPAGADGQAPGQPPAGYPGAQPGAFFDPRVDQMLAHQRQQEQQRLVADQQARERVATTWANETDAQGQPLRPYLSDVMTEMAAFVPQIRAAHPELSHGDVLQQAYERACWANPDVRALLVQKQQTDLEAQRRAENQQRVRDARRAASVNVPRRGSTPAPAKPGSLDETIRETARTLGLIG